MHDTLLLLTNRDQQIGLPLRGRPILLNTRMIIDWIALYSLPLC